MQIDFEATCKLGRRFQQNATFRVSQDRVRVVKLNPARQSAEVALLSERFDAAPRTNVYKGTDK